MDTTTTVFAIVTLVILILILILSSVYMMYRFHTNTSQDIIKKEIDIKLMQIKVAEGELETVRLKAQRRIKDSINDELASQGPNLMMLSWVPEQPLPAHS